MKTSWNSIYRNIEQVGLFIAKWVTIISSIVAVVGGVESFLQWGKKGSFSQLTKFLQEKAVIFWLIAITAMLITVLIRTSYLYQRFERGFNDNFKGNLDENWDYVGPWRIVVEDRALLVTGSDEGGITKKGTYWENYTMTFKARIINGCLGVIIRAQDLNNYYMFQIWSDKIRPHRRVAVPVVIDDKDNKKQNSVGVPVIQAIHNALVWQHDLNTPEFSSEPITPLLEDWFDVKIIVNGRSVGLYINSKLIYDRPTFLQIPAGKVGFRNSINEEALVKNVKVRLV